MAVRVARAPKLKQLLVELRDSSGLHYKNCRIHRLTESLYSLLILLRTFLLRIDDNIRSLCNQLLNSSKDEEAIALAGQLKVALHKHIDNLRKQARLSLLDRPRGPKAGAKAKSSLTG
jgi:hypothetical protein